MRARYFAVLASFVLLTMSVTGPESPERPPWGAKGHEMAARAAADGAAAGSVEDQAWREAEDAVRSGSERYRTADEEPRELLKEYLKEQKKLQG